MKHFPPPIARRQAPLRPPPDHCYALIAYMHQGVEFPQRPIPAQTFAEIYNGSGQHRVAVAMDSDGFVVFDLFYSGLDLPGLWQRYESRVEALEAAYQWSVT